MVAAVEPPSLPLALQRCDDTRVAPTSRAATLGRRLRVTREDIIRLTDLASCAG